MLATLVHLGPLEQRKRRALRWIAGSGVVILACLLMRFVPSLNDRLSGPPRYMQAFANAMAQQIAGLLQQKQPVLVARAEEGAECQSVSPEAAADYDDAYYLLSYSERARSLCLTIYGRVREGSKPASTIFFNPAIERNYGRPFNASVNAVPLHRNLTVLSENYLSLLHWRANPDPSLQISAGSTKRLSSPSAQVSFVDMSLSLRDIRAEVAKRHDLINRLLPFVMFVTAAGLLLPLVRIALLYSQCARYCRGFASDLPLREFLAEDLSRVAERIEHSYRERQQRLHTRFRLEQLQRRDKEAVQQRLEALLAASTDEAQRLLILRVLASEDSEEIHALLDQIEPVERLKTPEERLHLLLESLKEYCTEEELEQCQRDAFEVLLSGGFRQARTLVVSLHDQFRARTKALEDNELGTPDVANEA